MRDQLPAWIDLHHVAAGQRIVGRVTLHENEDWPAEQASVNLQLDFVQASSGRLGMAGEIQGQAQMICQRCLESMPVEWSTSFEMELVTSEAQAQRVEDAADVYVAEEGRIRLHELVREESVLALPMMPRHPDGACAPPGQYVVE